jgi:hypothetical protein
VSARGARCDDGLHELVRDPVSRLPSRRSCAATGTVGSGAKRIIDLCSGAGGPSLAIAREFKKAAQTAPPIVLTDKYPNVTAFRYTQASSGGTISFVEEPVDATSVPAELHGFRTLYTSFHHFDPPAARSILRDAVVKREGIGIFEYTERNFWIWGLPLLLTPLFTLLSMPFVRPFKWERLLWTYIIPIVPFLGMWDGLVSCLRTYSPSEMLALAKEADPADGYRWESGRVHAFGACHVTYLIGCPRS